MLHFIAVSLYTTVYLALCLQLRFGKVLFELIDAIEMYIAIQHNMRPSK